jgi:signal transduction histidine kinase/CheY-like chemotaxis protein
VEMDKHISSETVSASKSARDPEVVEPVTSPEAPLPGGEGRMLVVLDAALDAGKRTEAELRLYEGVFRNMTVGLHVWRLEDRENLHTLTLVSSNPAAAHVLGVRVEDVLGKRMEDGFPEFLETDLPRQCRDVIVSGIARDLGLVATGTGEGEEDAIFSMKAFPLGDDCVGVAFEDITARERLAAEQLQSHKMEAVGRLAAGLAHDFNNLLGVILGYTELLMRRAEDPQRGRFGHILSAAQRASSLTRQLVAFSRRQVVAPEALDLNSVVDNAEEMLRRLVGEEVDMVIVSGESIGLVRADPRQMEQVVMNLCANARDAMPHPPARGVLRIETASVVLGDSLGALHERIVPGPYVMLAVSDTGAGIEEEILCRIFDPFFTTREHGDGTGLGLSTVYGIVRQAGGYVRVDSEVGQGSTFRIYLPRVGDRAEAEPAEESATDQGSATILLVDDERSLRAIACEILADHGYRVLEAGRGDEALEVADRHGPEIDLLLTDVVMPRMNGRALAETLLRLRPALKVLYMSGYTDDIIPDGGVLPPGTLLVEKPFTAAALLRRVRSALGEGPAGAEAAGKG